MRMRQQLVIAAKDKKLHQVYKGLSANVVKEAFNWTDEYMVDEGEKVVYPQTPGSASGALPKTFKIGHFFVDRFFRVVVVSHIVRKGKMTKFEQRKNFDIIEGVEP